MNNDHAPMEQGRRLNLESFAGMDWEVAAWAWKPEFNQQPHGAIPVGSLAIFAGRPAAGKSSSGREFAAKVSRGTLPGCWAGTPHTVAYIAGEESLKYNVIPSLIAAGADMEKVFRPHVTFTPPDGITETVALVPDRDMRDLTDQLKAKGTKLVIVDPLMEYMGTDSDIYKNNEVRAKVKPWAKLAEDIDGVVIAIMHLNKSGNGDVVAGINGSSAFGEVARSVFGFAKDPGSKDGDRIMSQEKNSIGTEGAAWVYRIEGREITNAEGKSGEFGTFVMMGDSTQTVGEILRDASTGSRDGEGDDRSEIEAVVLDYLAGKGGSAPAGEVLKACRVAGLNDNAVKKARKKIGVRTEKSGMGGGWVWTMENGDGTPPKVPEGAEGARARAWESSAPSGESSEESFLDAGNPTGDPTAEKPPHPTNPAPPKLPGGMEAIARTTTLSALSKVHPQSLAQIKKQVGRAFGDGTEKRLLALVDEGKAVDHGNGTYSRKA